jgi:hypothetical protein
MNRNLPWGPHGAEAPPNTVTPNPTAASPAPAFEQPESVAMPTGGGDPFGSAVISIVLSVVMILILWIPAVCLYPLTAAAGIATTIVTRSISARVLPADAGDVPFALGIVLGAIVIGIMIRIEGRLARSAPYRMVRHGVRMVLLAIWAIPILQLTMGATAPGTSTAYIFAVVSSPLAMAGFLLNPLNLGAWLVSVIGLHFLIWKSERARRIWHRRLAWIGLK